MVVSKAIADGDINAINYFVAQKYVESLSQIASSPNSKLVFMPLDASGVVGSIGGVTELIRNLGGDGGAAGATGASNARPGPWGGK
jgi:hypothetical protein